MKNKKELRQTLAKATKEKEKAEQEFNMEQLREKTECIPALLFQNASLSGLILSLPNDEAKLVFKEVISDSRFAALVEQTIQSSPELDKLRAKKSAKAVSRKQKTSAQDVQSVREISAPNNNFNQVDSGNSI